jgi:hypothetical protein
VYYYIDHHDLVSNLLSQQYPAASWIHRNLVFFVFFFKHTLSITMTWFQTYAPTKSSRALTPQTFTFKVYYIDPHDSKTWRSTIHLLRTLPWETIAVCNTNVSCCCPAQPVTPLSLPHPHRYCHCCCRHCPVTAPCRSPASTRTNSYLFIHYLNIFTAHYPGVSFKWITFWWFKIIIWVLLQRIM